MAALVENPLATSEVPLSAVAGRVLAEALHSSAQSGEQGEQVLASGTLLRPAHVPLASSLGRSTVRVFERLRVGVMAVGCSGRAPPMKAQDSGTTVTLLSAAAEHMGAKTFVSTCDASDACHLLGSLKALLSAGCSLVLIAGTLDADMRKALERSGALREATAVSEVAFAPFGAIQVARTSNAHLVAVPSDPEMAYATFTALVSPLLRALSGRADVISPASSALLIDDQVGERVDRSPLWVYEQPALSRCSAARVVRRTSHGMAAIADASGIAWCPSDLGCVLPGAVAYIPL